MNKEYGCYNCRWQGPNGAGCGNPLPSQCIAMKHWQPRESDPTGRAASDAGAKLDAGKVQAGLLADFSLALMEVAKVSTYGANKYSRGGWQSVPDGVNRYKDAKWRHMLTGAKEERDEESGLLHDAQEIWNALAQLELKLRGQ